MSERIICSAFACEIDAGSDAVSRELVMRSIDTGIEYGNAYACSINCNTLTIAAYSRLIRASRRFQMACG
jgi:hypothetical protein